MQRARVSIVFTDLRGADEDDAVSPALPRTLQFLAERDLTASFVVDEDMVETEPFAATMIDNARHVRVIASPAADAQATIRSNPAEWHAAMQQTIGRAVSAREHASIAFDLAAVERGDGASLLAETLDLIAGLRRAGSLDVVTEATQT